MARTQKQKTFRQQVQKPILATALAAAGVFNMVNAVYAEGTPADTNISNTATATYDDDGDPTTPPINTTSNTVVVQVAKIAGLTVVGSPVNDVNGGAIEDGDDLEYTFRVENVGNAPTNVFIPTLVPDNLDIDRVEIIDSAGNVVNTITGNIPATGAQFDDLAPDESFTVKVYGTPADGTIAGEPVSVALGDTSDIPNGTTPEGPDSTQNQPSANDDGTSADNDLRTIAIGDAPTNGEREASAIIAPEFANAVNPLALATVLKSATQNERDQSDVTDDVITYSLGLRVEPNSPDPTFDAAALVGTEIDLDGNTEVRILVSDAVPEGTVFDSVSPILPTGWTAVYTNTNLTTDALSAIWSTTVPAGTITRVGFVYTGTLGIGETVSGLDFSVETSNVTGGGAIIENIAQVFGQTENGDPDQIIYDESGDQDPNNFQGSTPPTVPDGEPEGSYYDPTEDDGVPDPLTDGNGDNQPDDLDDVDSGNDNTGTGPGGEINVVSVTPVADPADQIYNGPAEDADAVGPSGDNDDFTNLSTPISAADAADPSAPFDPTSVTFNNTISNPLTTDLVEVTIEPLSVADAIAAADPTSTGTPDYAIDPDYGIAIPEGTLVTISYSDGGTTQSATYEYLGGDFVIDSGDDPVNVGTMAPGDVVDYTVAIDLPSVDQLKSVSVPIVAFPDDNPSTSAGYNGETTNNVTVDRVYTGFMELTKQASIIAADGTVVEGPADVLTEAAAPGESIEYVLSYENISESLGGAGGSVLLEATDFVIVDDGGATGIGTSDNNWAGFTTHEQGTVAESGTGVNYYTLSGDTTPAGTVDPASGTQVEKYENVVPSVAAGTSGDFSFRRMVIDEGPTPPAPPAPPAP